VNPRTQHSQLNLEPTKPFISDVDVTADVRKALRQRANMDCPQCKGEGTYFGGTGEKKLCRCVSL
jgi:hypothetical protein